MGRRGYPVELRRQAAKLRIDGKGKAEIARELHVGMSTVCRWFREDGIKVPAEYRGATRAKQEAVAERWARQQAEQDRHRDAVARLTRQELFLVGVALYWSEGTKSKPWRRSHVLKFVNSDESMVRVYLAWLDLLEVARSTLRCCVLIHESADVSDAERYWRRVVGPDPVFTSTCLKRHAAKAVRRNTGDGYHGCLSISVLGGAPLYRRVAGTWEGVVASIAPVRSSQTELDLSE